jgi:hypothetical protein
MAHNLPRAMLAVGEKPGKSLAGGAEIEQAGNRLSRRLQGLANGIAQGLRRGIELRSTGEAGTIVSSKCRQSGKDQRSQDEGIPAGREECRDTAHGFTSDKAGKWSCSLTNAAPKNGYVQVNQPLANKLPPAIAESVP